MCCGSKGFSKLAYGKRLERSFVALQTQAELESITEQRQQDLNQLQEKHQQAVRDLQAEVERENDIARAANIAVQQHQARYIAFCFVSCAMLGRPSGLHKSCCPLFSKKLCFRSSVLIGHCTPEAFYQLEPIATVSNPVSTLQDRWSNIDGLLL